MRLTYEQLQEIMKQENCTKIWSWSKWNCFHNSMYEYYLKYIRHAKEDRANSIYTTTGGIAHDILEKFYTKQITFEQMIELFEDGWLTAFEIADLKFDRNDEAHNKKIAEGYYNNLQHFFTNHVPLKYTPMIERFVKIKIGENLFQGYIDLCFKDSNNKINIIDFKTSSIYTGKKAEQECGQLVLYAIGLIQQGIPVERIRIAWNFLKYCSIQYQQANGEIKVRNVERCKIGESLQANAKVWLKKCGYADDMDEYLKDLLDTNSISALPQEVQEKYVISDCYVYLDNLEQLITKWTEIIENQIEDILIREKEYYDMKASGVDEETCSKEFWDSEESVKAQSYYYSTLCSYSPSLLLPYKAYLDKMEQERDAANVFGSVGESASTATVSTTTTTANNVDGIDLSWLDSI